MSDRVYIVTEEEDSYDNPDTRIVGVFTDADEARAFQRENYSFRELETWTTGVDGKQQVREQFWARHQGRFDYGVNPPEPQWATTYGSYQDIDEATLLTDSDRSDWASFITCAGWTPEEAAERLNEALKDFDKSKFQPVPQAYRWERRAYTLTDLQEIRDTVWASR